MKITFTAPFLRQLKKLHPDLQEEAVEKVELFEKSIIKGLLYIYYHTVMKHYNFIKNDINTK